MFMRHIFGSASSGWGRKFTEAQRQRWVQAALTQLSILGGVLEKVREHRAQIS
jgi:hypothetical protein